MSFVRYAWPFIGCLSAMLLASCLAAASSGSAGRSPADLQQPSHLDYVMLASMADSPHLMAMAAYRPARAENSTRTDDSARTDDPRTPRRPP